MCKKEWAYIIGQMDSIIRDKLIEIKEMEKVC